MRTALTYLLACLCVQFGIRTAAAQQYPDRPVRVVVGFGAGGSADTTARVIGQKLSERWSQQVIVDNRAGAAGVIGMQVAAKAPRDGYNLMIGSATQFTVGPALAGAQSQYPPLSSFTPIAKVVVAPIVLTVHPSLPIRSFKEFMQYGKARSGQLSYASTGIGTPNDIAMILIARSGGFEIVHVPYKGGGEVIAAAVGGQVPISLGSLATALPHIKSGRLRALAVTEARRLSSAPNLPTVAESGLPGFEVSQWFGFFAPADIPRAVTEKVGADLSATLAATDVREKLDSQGLEVSFAAPAEFAAYLKSESGRWQKLIKELGIKPQQ